MSLTPVKKDLKRIRETRETPSIQSLDRGLLILEAIGGSAEPVSLGQLAAMLAIDRSSEQDAGASGARTPQDAGCRDA